MALSTSFVAQSSQILTCSSGGGLRDVSSSSGEQQLLSKGHSIIAPARVGSLPSEKPGRRRSARPAAVTSSYLADQASMQADQFLRAAGVDTNDRRVSLFLAVSSQAARKAEETVEKLALETSKYINPRRGDARTLEEALMTVPDLETIPSTVVVRAQGYEIREVDEYVVAETEMRSRQGFDFFGASQAFNTLAGYLFGDNTKREEMEMTTPVIQTRNRPRGEEMEMTMPVINSQDDGKWKMAFVMPAKYGESSLPLPNDAAVKIRKVPAKTIAVVAFSGIVSDEEVKRREAALRAALIQDSRVRVKPGVTASVAQYNPPFTPPFARRNEVALEVEWTSSS